ncbi:MAG: hypothetical protein Q7U02_05820 [Desulfosalsimonadaceae bacterium]|nr:hypothetical protein [Desulfosalsimonadaceae bacterium]
MIKSIQIPAFEEFHASFKGQTDKSFKICSDCGGHCEYNLMAPLLPGEVAFIASKLNMPVDEVRPLYFDGVDINGEVIDLIKCTETCRFLSSRFSCSISAFKPVVCALHPIYFRTEGEALSLLLDEGCPLSHNRELRENFTSVGTKSLQQLSIPFEWFQITYDIYIHQFNYPAMVKERDVPADQYKLYRLDELMSYSVIKRVEL